MISISGKDDILACYRDAVYVTHIQGHLFIYRDYIFIRCSNGSVYDVINETYVDRDTINITHSTIPDISKCICDQSILDHGDIYGYIIYDDHILM